MNDMTEGGIRGHLLRFALPLLVGDIFQQMYHAVDSILVGRLIGEDAFAAVGVAYPVVNVILFLIVGLCVGASVLMSQMYGAGDTEGFRREVSTSFFLGAVGAVLIGITTVIFLNPLLRAIQTPDVLMEDTRRYLLTIFGGLIFTFLYNIYSAAFRSVGNAKAGLFFLIFSSVANVVLDILFIAVFSLGVFGAALATVLSQALSVLLCALYSRRRVPVLHLRRSNLVFDKEMAVRTFRCSWISALQQASLHIGILLIQRAVNPLGTSAIAAFTAVSRLDAFVLLGNFSISNAMTTFIAQNLGAEKYGRIRKGFSAGRMMLVVYCAAAGVFVMIFKESLIGLFVKDISPKILEMGSAYYRVMAPGFLLAAFGDSCQGYFRGVGRFDETLLVTVLQITIRVILTYMLVEAFRIQAVAIAMCCGWSGLVVLSGIWQKRHLGRLLGNGEVAA
ncbi:MAG: MATE family efflux transporter [Lachnospiraceae bacterium]|nr:MATE family efflux transporter [Lachnospiraceae bacterium]